MIKGILIGALLVVGLVGYGVLDTNDIESAGSRFWKLSYAFWCGFSSHLLCDH
mgnify:CR=1 FL=1